MFQHNFVTHLTGCSSFISSYIYRSSVCGLYLLMSPHIVHTRVRSPTSLHL